MALLRTCLFELRSRCLRDTGEPTAAPWTLRNDTVVAMAAVDPEPAELRALPWMNTSAHTQPQLEENPR